MRKHIIFDLETLSVRTNASIVSIAAVAFDIDNGEIFDEIKIDINPNEWNKNNRHIDGYTIKWWLNQDNEVVKDIFGVKENLYDLKTALSKVSEFVDKHITNELTVWGNGSTMDITILQSAYEYFDMSTPWKYWQVNDVRTIVALIPEIKENMNFIGQKHSPIDDCKHEIRYLVATLNNINRK